MEDKQVTVTLEQKKGYEFHIKFDEGVELLMDEPEPLGEGRGPNASKVLSAAVGNCLSASLLFCLQKARVETRVVRTTVTTKLTRNEQNRLRIGSSLVKIEIDLDRDSAPARADRCIELFEDFCIVTASVRNGVDVKVEVVDQNGKELYKSD
ncbi:MAG: OsmC family protein [Candidatus Zixiibacteriota bacterium]|nr:MAG: OsmC family protein [candidate division Zixibacteria bacterium]